MAMRCSLVMIVSWTASMLDVRAAQHVAQPDDIAQPLESNLSVRWRFDSGG